MQGKFSKIRGRFESRRPVTTAAYQVTGWWERVIDTGSEVQINRKLTEEDQGN